MEKKVNCILLVDDDPDDNMLHQMVINESGICEKVRVALDGTEALDYLQNKGKFEDVEENPLPEVILLDINMPKMNGFEFLEAYKLMENSNKANIVVAMLTTSLSPTDKEKADQIDEIKLYINKPLDKSHLEEIISID